MSRLESSLTVYLKLSLKPRKLVTLSTAQVGSKIKRSQTFSIILPNLIHQSRKKDLKN